MKTFEFHFQITKILKIVEFHERITALRNNRLEFYIRILKIMKIIEDHKKIVKIIKIK